MAAVLLRSSLTCSSVNRIRSHVKTWNSLCSTTKSSPPIFDVFEAWCKEHRKTYPSEQEKEHRLKVFQKNYEFITANYSDKVRLNDMADISDEEFRAMYSVYRCGCDKRTEGSCVMKDVDAQRLPKDFPRKSKYPVWTLETVLNSSPVDDSIEPTTSVLESSRAPDSDSGHPGDYVMVQVIISSCYCEVNNGAASCLSKVGSSLNMAVVFSTLPFPALCLVIFSVMFLLCFLV
ncbi:hypothetical protein BUALT_Bualt06G0045400 [Buddleja alternifolia]|uniref:Cathepsin propeptide inhibitor domain-containing protein n=1 Tax=Buddleja alternifolia TaxID=168488 RepID=A0AAV6XCX4_9LAMI|nr:hypothetical protein BUALT_Bualt06G0045400 [Buddleja alternifolia]